MENDQPVTGFSPILSPGAILVRADTRLPSLLASLETQLLSGWNLLDAGSSATFFQKLKEAGWQCFYIGGEIVLTSTRRTPDAAMSNLVERIGRMVERRECNCIEIVGIEVSRFLWFSSIRLDAQARHVQKGSQGHVAQGRIPE